MSGFKLLAIRPLVGCDKRFLKNLNEGEVYQFYNTLTFKSHEKNINNSIDSENEISEIYIQNSSIDNLYSSLLSDKDLKINISAIVGENGSGKSALSELILYSLFSISNKLRFVKKDNFLFDEMESINFKNDLETIKKGFRVEFYYQIKNTVNVVRIVENEIFLHSSNIRMKKIQINRKKFKIITRRDQLSDFFYTMVVNYSLFAFNSNEIGIWIKSIFHKNDGYQMPVVVNPFRDLGRIDVNQETYLTRARFLSNIISIRDYKKIDSSISVDKITFYRDQVKIDKLNKLIKDKNKRITVDVIENLRNRLIIPLYKRMFSNRKTEVDYPIKNTDLNNINNIVELYLINKLITIPTKYSQFDEFKFLNQPDLNFYLDDNSLESFLDKIYEDRSHVTLKIRQSLNFLRYNIFEVKKYDSYFEIDFDEIVSKIELLNKNNPFTEIVDYLPPSVFFNEVKFTDGRLFSNLSSGQKQSIFSLNSIIYHLKNIDSVHKSSSSKRIKKYESINLILDEIELYFHPSFQQKYINHLLELIKSCHLEFIKNINIIFLTHSPFILTDIPNSSVLKLIDGNPENYKENEQTFGANINDLLANEFFLHNGFMGEFVKDKINSLVKYLDNDINVKRKWNPNNAKEFIELIGEPLIRLELRELYFNKFYNNNQIDIKKIDEEIERLKKIRDSKINE